MPERADLFQAALERRLETQAPLADRMRPRTLDDMVGQRHLLGVGRPLRALIESDRLSSALLWGPPGTGKTTLARLIAGVTKRAFVGLSAVTAGVKDVRETVEEARRLLGEQGRGTVLFLDEVHRFNRTQQDALLPSVEAGELTLIGATTENPFFSINGPLLSRSTLFRLEPLSEAEVLVLLRRALDHEGASAEEEALVFLAGQVDGDARAALNSLEVAIALAAADGRDVVAQADVEAARSTRALRYGDDEHYDVISAFIKSIRGSDADAGLYWLARMLEAGEDARFIARRLVILASEDVGMADPEALLVADAAARAVEFVGLPEAQLNLAQAVVHLANAPKSNSVTAALGKARADVAELAAGTVPRHLKDASYRGAARLGHGKGYIYPHGEPGGWVAQQYRPAELEGRTYWEPTGRGRDVRRDAFRGEASEAGGDRAEKDRAEKTGGE
ncbi:MAG TPA: replication-associated recombination protein A [Acidimicrobiales bacterium]|nr:replication-associated recombination protein A [Acidimicrobiales bacterium]